jgi:threonine/homoserine/homoserine lactone efflux protein
VIASLAAAVGVLALLTIVPGPDMAVVTRVALSGGRRQAAHTAAGVVLGLLVWGVLAVAGLAAVLAASAEAYTAVKIAGAVFLVTLGLQTLWRSRRSGKPDQKPGVRPGGGGWRTGLLTNLLNPKIAVFYTGLLPQLVPVGAPTTATQAGLVLAHAGLSLLWLNCYALLLGRSRSALNRPTVRRALDRVTGTVLIALGLQIATH